jgi:hypothetical protein
MGYPTNQTNLWGRIHEVELKQIFHTQRLQQQDCIGQIRPLNLRNCVGKQLVSVRHFSVKAVAEPGISDQRHLIRMINLTNPLPVRPARPVL